MKAAKRNSERTTGVILRHDEQALDSFLQEEDDPYPVVQYAISTGESITETYHISSRFYAVGAKVLVYYNPTNPREFILDDMVSASKPGIMIFFGLLTIILSFYVPAG